MQPKNKEVLDARAQINKDRVRTIAREWLSFSKTTAYQDLIDYGSSTSDMLTTYAKEGVMPSPIKEGEQIILDGEKALSLLQNSRGCDIILSYIEQYVDFASKK